MIKATMDYIDSTLAYIKTTLDAIKSAIITTKDVMVSIANIIGTIVDILGFIGFRVFLLLITTAFILWLLNLVSPISRKTNYFIAVAVVLWIGISAKMPVQIVIVKYILIISSPFFITYLVNFIITNFRTIYNVVSIKLYAVFAKIDFQFLRNKTFKIKKGEDIGILFSSDLPTMDEIYNSKDFISSLGYNLLVCEEEKISLTDNDGRIIFPADVRFFQLVQSLESKNIKLVWFWSQFCGSDEILEKLYANRKIIQRKFVIGNGDNSFILNFLQEMWGWKVIYGKNLKDFDGYTENVEMVDEILNKKAYGNLSLVNDFELKEDYCLKEKVVGGDLAVLVNGFGSRLVLNFKNRILFFDGYFESDRLFYRAIMQLKNYILNNNSAPKAIVMGNIQISDGQTIAYVVSYLNQQLKEKNINIPIFQGGNLDFIFLNSSYVIHYSNSVISLTRI